MNFFLAMEVYPSSAEGIGLENRQGSQIPRGFESLYLLHFFKKQQVVLKQPYILGSKKTVFMKT